MVVADATRVAPDDPVASTVSTSVTLTSQYVSRGWRQIWGKPAPPSITVLSLRGKELSFRGK